MTLDLIVLGLAITLEPIPLGTFILLIASKRGVRKGAAFIFGWLLSLAGVIAATVFITGNAPPKANSAPSIAAILVKMLIGVALVVVAVIQRRKMGRPKKPKKKPKWQTGIDNMSLWFACLLGPLVQPWGLVAAGVAVIANAEIGSAQSWVALILFCLLATSSILVLEILAGFWPERASAIIERVRAWIDTHTDQLIIIVSLAVGFYLIASSAYYLVTS